MTRFTSKFSERWLSGIS